MSDQPQSEMNQDPRLQRLLRALPHPARRFFDWLLQPHLVWVRMPAGFLLIAGGFLGFLPILGFWMVPLGALLVGEDIPPVRRVTLNLLGRIQAWWDARTARRHEHHAPR